MDSIGKPGTGDGGIHVVVAVEFVALELVVVVVELVVVVLLLVEVVVWMMVVVDVVVPGTLSGP
jgi:hypothetical protein